MRIFFSLLSAGYVLGIFLFADSSMVSDLSPFNPYSLLHIPLYGVFAFFLVFSFVPIKQDVPNTREADRCLFLSGLLASGVAIADEIHQAYVPGRCASSIDVMLDLLGISLMLFGIHHFLIRKKRGLESLSK